MNLFFYPDSPKILETRDFEFTYQVFPECQDRKTNLFACFWEKFWLNILLLRFTDL